MGIAGEGSLQHPRGSRASTTPSPATASRKAAVRAALARVLVCARKAKLCGSTYGLRGRMERVLGPSAPVACREMGSDRRSAEHWAERRVDAEKTAGALAAIFALGLAAGGPPVLSIAAAGLAAANGILAGVLRVAERRTRRRERDGSSRPGSSEPVTASLQDVPDDAVVVFVSYAREDDEWRRRFETMLAPLGGRGVVLWSDERVAVDAAWNLELQRAIARADAALVLVSPELLASEMILREELPALRGRDIPRGFVHVRASLVSQVHGLSDVGWLHNPAQPLHGATNPDGQIVTICERLVGLLPPREAHEPEAGWWLASASRSGPASAARHPHGSDLRRAASGHRRTRTR